MKNDKLILELQKQVEEKEKALKLSEKFAPITHCSLDMDGTRINLNVASKEQLQMALVKLAAYNQFANGLGLEDFVIAGYSPSDWMADIKARLAVLDRNNEKAKLKAMKEKLHTLLSHDKKVELELEAIIADLK